MELTKELIGAGVNLQSVADFIEKRTDQRLAQEDAFLWVLHITALFNLPGFHHFLLGMRGCTLKCAFLS